jgi:hypothetical protein
VNSVVLDRSIYEGQFCIHRARSSFDQSISTSKASQQLLVLPLEQNCSLASVIHWKFLRTGRTKVISGRLALGHTTPDLLPRSAMLRRIPGRLAAVSLKTWSAVAIPGRHTPSAELEAAHAAHPLQAFLDPLFRPASLPLYSATQPACGAMTGRCHLARRQSD